NVWIFRFELRELRAIADDELRAWEIELQKRFDVLFDGDAADVEMNGARQIEPVFRTWLKELDVNAARPQAQVSEAAAFELALERARRDHHRRCRRMKPAQSAICPSDRH